MDQAARERIANLELQIAAGEQQLTHQREHISELERDGQDTSQAKRLLAIFEEGERQSRAERDRLKRSSI